MEWIIISAFVVVFAILFVWFMLNSAKINKNDPKKSSTPKSNPTVKVESKITKESPIDIAIKEQNKSLSGAEIQQAFNMIDAERKAYESLQRGKSTSRLQVDRGDNRSEIEIMMAEGQVLSSRNHLKSETNIIGVEGPSAEQIAKVNAEIDSEGMTKSTDPSVSEQITNLSPELKAVLLNDILNKKY